MKKLLILIALILLACAGFSQANNKPIYEVITAPSGSFTTWTFLPANYNPANKYAWLVFVTGSGEIRTGTRSTDSTRMVKYGPGRGIIRATWDGKGLVRDNDGVTRDTTFITSIIQTPTVQTARSNASRIADSLMKRYAIDTMRKSFTGLSMGGQMANQLIAFATGSASPNITWEHYTDWASIFAFSTPFPTGDGASISNFRLFLDKGGLYYNGGGANDPNSIIEPSDLDSLKNAYPGQVFAFTYPNEAHDSWNNRYERPSFYDSIFLRDKYPMATIQSAQTTTSTSGTISGTVKGYAATYSYFLVSGPGGFVPTVVYTEADTTATVTGMTIDGVYTFKLRVTNGHGASPTFHEAFTTITKSTPASGKPASKIAATKKAGTRLEFIKE